jgi:excinuclease ABC subunit C
MTTKSDHIAQIVANLPESPGVYQYLDKTGTIIYVGKAKNLKRRVSSYFNKNQDRIKTRILVSKIVDLKYIVVNSEEEALLLENNLIKKHQPRYNILLKDGKTYPSVCIKREPFPRVFVTRNIIKDGSEYFGPFSNVNFTNYLVEYFHEIFQLRTCKLDLSDSNIDKKYHKVCLEYHIKKCAGCCQGLESKESYNQKINQIREILKGNIHIVVDDLKSKWNDPIGKRFIELILSCELYVNQIESNLDVLKKCVSNYDVNTGKSSLFLGEDNFDTSALDELEEFGDYASDN